MALSRADTISQTLKKVETYSDFSNNFSKHPITNELVMVKNEDSVRQAFKNLILTNLEERFFSPFFGSNINRTVFENYGPFVREDIIRYIKMAAVQFEKRVEVLLVDIVDEMDKNRLKINVVFSIINIPEPVALSIFLKRVR
jgi:phage baseplate assembly protein W